MSFRRWYDQLIIRAKSRFKIIILGSYDAIGRLCGIRDHLRNNNYSKAGLVADFEYPLKESWESKEEYYYRKSKFVMEYGDVLLFIFFDKVNNQGVVTEINFVVHELPQKIQFSTVFIEESFQSKLSSMVKGLIETHKIDCKFFRNDSELKKLTHGTCSQYLYISPWIWQYT